MAGSSAAAGPWSLERVFELFPMLAERRNQRSMSLSGGQQQMVAIGRALMSNPRLLLCDEISLGLAPIVVREIFQRLPMVVAEGTAVVVVEQDVVQALAASNYLYCLQEGRVLLQRRLAEPRPRGHQSRLFRSMSAMGFVNIIVQGVLLGGLYALFAAGLSLIFGVMRLVNIAHGDLIVVAAYFAFFTMQALGVGPFTSLIVVVPASAALGYVLQRGLLNFTLGDDAAAAARHLRPVGHHPERSAHPVHPRQPQALCRADRDGELEIHSRSRRSACCRSSSSSRRC